MGAERSRTGGDEVSCFLFFFHVNLLFSHRGLVSRTPPWPPAPRHQTVSLISRKKNIMAGMRLRQTPGKRSNALKVSTLLSPQVFSLVDASRKLLRGLAVKDSQTGNPGVRAVEPEGEAGGASPRQLRTGDTHQRY